MRELPARGGSVCFRVRERKVPRHLGKPQALQQSEPTEPGGFLPSSLPPSRVPPGPSARAEHRATRSGKGKGEEGCIRGRACRVNVE